MQRAKNSKDPGLDVNIKLNQILESEDDIWLAYEYLPNFQNLHAC